MESLLASLGPLGRDTFLPGLITNTPSLLIPKTHPFCSNENLVDGKGEYCLLVNSFLKHPTKDIPDLLSFVRHLAWPDKEAAVCLGETTLNGKTQDWKALVQLAVLSVSNNFELNNLISVSRNLTWHHEETEPRVFRGWVLKGQTKFIPKLAQERAPIAVVPSLVHRKAFMSTTQAKLEDFEAWNVSVWSRILKEYPLEVALFESSPSKQVQDFLQSQGVCVFKCELKSVLSSAHYIQSNSIGILEGLYKFEVSEFNTTLYIESSEGPPVVALRGLAEFHYKCIKKVIEVWVKWAQEDYKVLYAGGWVEGILAKNFPGIGVCFQEYLRCLYENCKEAFGDGGTSWRRYLGGSLEADLAIDVSLEGEIKARITPQPSHLEALGCK